MNKQQIKDLALSNGFKLKQQPSGEMDLNPYVYEFSNALLAKANERVKELEWTLCNLDAFKKSFSAITYTDKNKVFSSYREDTDFSEDLEPVVLQYLLEKGE